MIKFLIFCNLILGYYCFSLITSTGTFSGAHFAATDNSGNFWISDEVLDILVQYSTSGTLLATFISLPNIDGIGFLSSTNQYIYYANYLADTVIKFDLDASLAVITVGSLGTLTNQFLNPQGLAVGSNNQVYVVDSDNHRIQYFDDDLNYIGNFGSSQLSDPWGIMLDSSNNVYVTDSSNAVYKFDASGTFTTSFSLGMVPYGIAMDTSGNFYVTFFEDDILIKYDSTFSTELDSISLDNPWGVAVSGSYIVVTLDNGPAYFYSISGGNNDPHFIGFKGHAYEFFGLHNKIFNIISEERLQFNSRFFHYETEYLADYSTWMTEYGIRIGEHQIYVIPFTQFKNNVFLDNYPIAFGDIIQLNEEFGDNVARYNSTIVIKSNKFIIEISIDTKGHEQWCSNGCPHLDFNCYPIVDLKFLNSEGILGSSWKFDALNPIYLSDTDEKYLVKDGIWGTDFPSNKYQLSQ